MGAKTYANPPIVLATPIIIPEYLNRMDDHLRKLHDTRLFFSLN